MIDINIFYAQTIAKMKPI